MLMFFLPGVFKSLMHSHYGISYANGVYKDYPYPIDQSDIIHNDRKISYWSFLNRNISCSEYLYNGENEGGKMSYLNENIIVPIPINHCFINDSRPKKIGKILEYINYLNEKSGNIFKYDIIKNQKYKNLLYNKYFEKSKLSSHNKEVDKIHQSILFSGILENVTLNDFNDSSYRVRDCFRSNSSSESFIKRLLPDIKNLFSKYGISNQASEESNVSFLISNRLIISNPNNKYGYFEIPSVLSVLIDGEIKTNFSINRLIEVVTKKDSNNLLNIFSKNINKSRIDTIGLSNVKKQFLGEFFTTKEFIDSKDFLKLAIEFRNLISKSILKCSNELIHKDDNYYIINTRTSIKLLHLINNYIEKPESFKECNIIEEIYNNYRNNFIFVKIDIKNSKMKVGRGLLLSYTLLRYLFKRGYNHIPELILKFKDNTRDINLYENLYISSQFHQGTAWNRYNISSCLDYIDKKRKKDFPENVNDFVRYYFMNPIEYIESKLQSTGSYSINDIFDSWEEPCNSKEDTRDLYDHLNELLLEEKYEEILNFFRERKKFKKNKKVAIFKQKSLENKELKKIVPYGQKIRTFRSQIHNRFRSRNIRQRSRNR